MEVINYTDLRSNLKHWLDKVLDDVSELVIKRKGKKNLVLVPLDEYNSLKETTYLLKGANRDVLLKSVAELEKGNGTEKELIE
jgi:antitoxin YefM